MYNSLKTALSASGIPFAEFAWNNAPPAGSYGVIALEMDASTVWADGQPVNRALQGSIDLFSRSNTPKADRQLIEAVLMAQGVAWSLNSTQYEREKHLTHYEWVFEVEKE